MNVGYLSLNFIFLIHEKGMKALQRRGQSVCISVLQSPNICCYQHINRRTCPSVGTTHPFKEQPGNRIEHEIQSHDDSPQHKSIEALHYLIFIVLLTCNTFRKHSDPAIFPSPVYITKS